MISQVRTRSASNSLQNFKSTNHDCNYRLNSAVQLFILQLFSTKKKSAQPNLELLPFVLVCKFSSVEHSHFSLLAAHTPI